MVLETSALKTYAVPLLLCLLVGLSGAALWHGYYYTIGIDGFHYVHAGVSLISTGRYLNPSGGPEVWFPPMYPLLIGAGSAGGKLDPLIVARGITLCAALAVVLLTWQCARRCTKSTVSAGLAAAIVATNALFLRDSTASLSEIICLAFLTGIFLLWLYSSSSIRSSLLFGAGSAMAFLTRPEAILAPLLWFSYDTLIGGKSRKALLWSAAAFVILILPYSIYLFRITGHFISNKGEVNLASGRALYYQWPREWIDSQTLTLGYYSPPGRITFRREVRRYIETVRRMRAQYLQLTGGSARVPAAISLFTCMLTAFLYLKGRERFGVLAQFMYLLVIPLYAVKDRYLLLSLPAVAILFGAAARGTHNKKTFPGVLLLAAALAGPVWQLKELRHTFSEKQSHIQQKVAAILHTPADAVFLEDWSRVAYYANRTRQQITRNSLDVNIRYAQKLFPGKPLYVVLLNSQPDIDGSLKLLPEAEMKDRGDEIVVLRVAGDASGPI